MHANQMGQVEQHEDDGAYQQQGAEETQVAQGSAAQWHEGEKGTHGCHIAYYQGSYYLSEGAAYVGGVIQMGGQMKGVVHGYADDD